MRFYPILMLLLLAHLSVTAQKPNNLESHLLSDALSEKGITLGEDEDYRITASHTSSTSLVKHNYYIQRHNGIEVYGAVASTHNRSDGLKLRSKVEFVDQLTSKLEINGGTMISPTQAIQSLAEAFQLQITEPLIEIEGPADRDLAQLWSDGGISLQPIPIKLMYQRYKSGGYILTWDLVLHHAVTRQYWNLRIDAYDGSVVGRDSWTVSCNLNHEHDHHSCSPEEHKSHQSKNINKGPLAPIENISAANSLMVGSYMVYPYPIESPLHGDRSLISNPDNAVASPYGWHDTNGVAGAEYTVTRGNNVNAYEQGDNNGFQPDGGAGLVFNFPVDTNYTNTVQSESAAITNLFYWTNLIHDIYYHHGFDEASGNFQANNYGNGGIAGDQVNAEAQDGGGTCNAFFSTPTDGSSPTMEMFVCGDRDGDFDNAVIAHEFGHGISTRLTGGAGTSSCLNNTEQMGEGWSDYFGLMLTIESGDTGTDARPIGNWLFQEGPTQPGLRTHPYSTNLAINPHTYDDINSEVAPHGVGSVWAMMLWEMTWAIIAVEGFDTDFYTGTGGNNIAMKLVIEGLKLQPCSPGMVDGRDAILDADQALYNGLYSCIIWEAFAKRGLGFNADQGSSNSKTDGTENFDLPPGCINPLIEFTTDAFSLSENDLDDNAATAGDCRTYNDYSFNVALSIDASASTEVSITNSGTAASGYDFEIIGSPLTFTSFGIQSFTLRVFDDGETEANENIQLDLTITNSGTTNAALGTINSLIIPIEDNDLAPGSMSNSIISNSDFESGLGGMTTNNPGGGDSFATGNAAAASSGSWTVPDNGTGNVAYVNDDACNCTMLEVNLFTPIYDLTNLTSSELVFDLFFEGRTYSGDTETAELLVSTNGGTTFTSFDSLAGINGAWRTETYDMSAYDGMNNIQFAIRYSDATGWLYGLAADNFKMQGLTPFYPSIASTLMGSETKSLSPNSEVHFYNASGELMASINNQTHDFGCVTATQDRDGNQATALWDTATDHQVTDKTFLVTSTNNNTSAAYELTLYYTGTEASTWESETSKAWDTDAKVIKHPTTITDISAANPEPNGAGTVEQLVTSAGQNSFDINSNYITADFSSGFSGITVGDPGPPPSNACSPDLTPPNVFGIDIVVALGINGMATVTADLFDLGSSDDCSAVSFSVSEDTFDCADVGAPVNVVFIVTDGSGNSATSQQTVTVQDNTPPIVNTSNINVGLDNAGLATITPALIDAGSSDNCGIANLSLDIDNFSCSDLGPVVVTLTATDASGGSNSSTATVTVVDNLAPVVETNDVTVSLDNTGNVSITESLIDNNTVDNCSTPSLDLNTYNFGCADLGSPVVVTLTATDVLGNSSSSTANVTVLDELAPTVITNASVFVALDNTGSATITPAAIDNGSNDNCSIAMLSLDTNTFSCVDLEGPVVVTLTATDGSGNSSTGTAIVTVEDNNIPTVITQDITVDLGINGSVNIIPSQIDNMSTDNCGILSLELDQDVFDCNSIGNQIVILTATDFSGNTASNTASVSITDNLPPTIVTQDVTINLDPLGMASLTAAEIDNGSTDNCGSITLVIDTETFFCNDIGFPQIVTLTATDSNNNISSSTASVTVVDALDPMITPEDITVELGIDGTVSITPEDVINNIADNCSTSFSTSIDIDLFDCSNIDNFNVVSVTATDDSGNSGTVSASVTVQDNIAPTVITQNVMAEIGINGEVTITPAMVDNGSSDNCSIGSMVLDVDEFSCNNIGIVQTVVLTVTDDSFNSSSGSAMVTVVDNLAPLVSTQDITVSLNTMGQVIILASEIDNGSTDNCGFTNLALDIDTFSCSDIGDHVVTLTVSDGSGNMSSGTASVSILDEQPPMIVTQDLTVNLGANGTVSITAAMIDNGTSDNCAFDNMSIDVTDFNCIELEGPVVVTLTATDSSLNSSTGTAIVTIQDNIPPTVFTQDITLYIEGDGMAMATPNMIDNGSSDNCGLTTMSLSKSLFDCTDLGTQSVTLTVSDYSGNSTTGTANVSVLDDLAPSVLTQDITVSLMSDGTATITPEQIDNNSSDNCEITSLSLNLSNFNCNDIGVQTVFLTATDASSNSALSSASVTIIDDLGPTAIAQDLTVDLGNDGMVSINANMVNNGSSAACGLDGLTLDQSSFDCSDVGIQIVTLTVFDLVGGSDTATANITINDDLGVEANAIGIMVALGIDGTVSITAADIDDGSTANCGILMMEIDQDMFDCSSIGFQTVTLTVTDNNGTTATVTAQVEVTDPDSNCCAMNLVLNDNPIDNKIHQVSEQIDSEGTVVNPGDVSFKAGTEINLLSGFEVELGAIFEATIDPCGN